MGPLTFPRERGPDLFPVPKYPQGRGRHSYNDLWPFGGRRAVAVTNSRELLLLGHISTQNNTTPHEHED